MSSAATEAEIPNVRFTQRERRGALLGRSWPQLIIAGVAILLPLSVALVGGWPSALPFALPALPVIAIALWNFRGEPLLKLLMLFVSYVWRAVRRQTRFRRDVWAEVVATEIPVNKSVEMVPVPDVVRAVSLPRVVSGQALPGALADVQIVEIPTRGAFFYNAKAKAASVTVEVKAPAWLLRDESAKLAIYDSFGAWLSSLEGLAGLTEADLRVRVDRAPSTALIEYAMERDEARTTQVSEEVTREYDWLASTEQARSMEFTSTITATFDVEALTQAIRDSGGGLVGLGAVLADRVKAIEDALDRIGVTFGEWMDATTLEAFVSQGLDPVTASARRQRLGGGAEESASRPPLMSIDEKSGTLEIDDSVHSTLWIHEWPRTKVKVGFLRPLLYTGEATRCLLLRFRPVPTHEAMKELSNASTDVATSASLRERWGSRETVLHAREEEDLEERETDIADGFTDGRFRAWVTISAPTVAEVRRDQASLEQAGYQAHVRLGLLRWQQWTGLVTTVLPIPTRGRGVKK